MTEPEISAEKVILELAADQKVSSPVKLLAEIKARHPRLTEIDLREAFWRLVSTGELELSEKREVRRGLVASL